MALVTRSAIAGMDTTTGMLAPHITGLIAGEDIDVAAPCYIDSTTGQVFMANATAADQKARVAGFSPRAAKLGEPITLFGVGTRFHYADSGLTPGAMLFVGATKGRLDTAATTGDAVGIVQCIDTTDVRVTRAV